MRHPDIPNPVQFQPVHAQEPVVVAYVAIGIGGLVDLVKIAIFGNQAARVPAGAIAQQPVLGLVDISAVVVQIVEQLLADNDIALFFKAYVTSRGKLLVRKREV